MFAEFDTEDSGILGIVSEDFLPIPDQENLGNSNLTFEGLLEEPGLQVYEDGGATGCGGKLWPAGELLSTYMIHIGLNGARNVVELGSGTGLVGLAIALHERQQREKKLAAGQDVKERDLDIWVTDQINMVPLMEKNIELNTLEKNVHAAVLDWGEPLAAFSDPDPKSSDYEEKKVDVVLAADCVYLEAAFPLLEKTLLDLTVPRKWINKETGEEESDDGPLVLMAYKKRRKADARFFRHMRKSFVFEEITDYPWFQKYRSNSVFLYKIIRKQKGSAKKQE